ncbi:MAG: CDP-glycerol glycerophosphotransferase family protein [Bacteroidales bacterium]|nr:CDP-glycerol glycerophosphotransferase family protein [Bacteroidales bacterium]
MSKSKITDIVSSLFLIIFGWLVVAPLALLIPRNKRLFVTVSRNKVLFSDNTKYLFIYLKKSRQDWLSYHISDVRNKKNQCRDILYYPSVKAIWVLLRASVIAVDYSGWFTNFKYHLSIKAKKIQLWHGVGSKKIEMATDQFTKSRLKKFRILYGLLRGQLIKYHLFASTSDYYTEHLYKGAFFYKHIKNFGQPRNDALYRLPNELDLIGSDEKIINLLVEEKRKNNAKVVLYSPTYRSKIEETLINYESLDIYCKNNNILFVVKPHSLSSLSELNGYSNVLYYQKAKDIYPLFSLADLMITDYSSIYLDYILLNKPIIFYLADYEAYHLNENNLRADYLDITPGTKCYSQNELEEVLVATLFKGRDDYSEQRQEIINLSYEFQDDKASQRIIDFLTL